MKTFIYVPLLLLSFKAYSQDSLVFKMTYLPGHKYTSVNNIMSSTEMNIIADKEILDKIKSKGVQLPLVIEGETTMEYEIQTGTVNKDNIFPIIIIYKRINSVQTMNGTKKTRPESPFVNSKIYAHYDVNNRMQLDSISGTITNDSTKTLISNMIKTLQSQVMFPKNAIKIGDTFSQELPMSIPINGNNMQIVIKIIYKLIEIKSGNAFFDLDEKADFKLSMEQGNMDMTGFGNGKMIFDVNNQYILSNTTNLNFNYTVQMEKMSMKGIAKISSVHTTTIN